MVVLSPDVLSEIRMTVDEYLQADLPEGHRYELVEGVVQVVPSPDMPHDTPVEKLHEMLVVYKLNRPDLIGKISQRAGVVLIRRETVREPDIAVYTPMDMQDKHGKTWKNIVPVLVMEAVSPGQGARDYHDKRKDYWDAGVQEYWIADPKRKTLMVLRRGKKSAWIESSYKAGDVYRPKQFPGLEIPVAELFD